MRPRVNIEGIIEGSGASLQVYVNANRQIFIEISDGNGHRTGQYQLVQMNSGVLDLSALPTEDPEVDGQAWINDGIVTVSAGEVP